MITRVAAALLSLTDKHIAGYHARHAMRGKETSRTHHEHLIRRLFLDKSGAPRCRTRGRRVVSGEAPSLHIKPAPALPGFWRLVWRCPAASSERPIRERSSGPSIHASGLLSAEAMCRRHIDLLRQSVDLPAVETDRRRICRTVWYETDVRNDQLSPPAAASAATLDLPRLGVREKGDRRVQH
jgi:hypothetical protein